MHLLAHDVTHPVSHWYTPITSLTTLTIVLILLTVGLIGQAFYYRRVGSPRPVIVYRMSRPTLLVANRLLREAADEIIVSFRDEQVKEPHAAALTVDCKGRRDIADEDFYREHPAALDLGARIVTMLYSDPERTKISPETLPRTAAGCW